jgi:hypothetical protein
MVTRRFAITRRVAVGHLSGEGPLEHQLARLVALAFLAEQEQLASTPRGQWNAGTREVRSPQRKAECGPPDADSTL